MSALGDLLEPDERWRRPSPRLATMRRTEVVVAAVVAALAAGTIGWLAGGPAGAGAGAVAAALAGLLADRLLQRRVRSWGYCERDDDLLVRRGVIVARLSVIPYGRMQFVDVVAGPIERSFGLATVRMHTAAAASDARIPGLAEADASRLRDQLATLGEARAAGV
jgi:uncharacterized protein